MNKKETTRVLNNNKDLLALYYKVVDKLEKRIATLEKVLQSHAKCIGELREIKVDNPIKGRVIVTEEIK
jgi:NAD+--asparagine ADP-ribosyltransferase